MLEQLVVLPLLLTWVLLVTTIAPITLSNRKLFVSMPNFGLAVWFLVFISAALATVFAVGFALWSMYRTYQSLSSTELFGETWFIEFVLSLVPWAILALTGVTLAWINIKLDPMFQSAKDIHAKLAVVGTKRREYRGIPVMEFAAEFPTVFSTKHAGGFGIFISSETMRLLSDQQLDIVFEHEFAHIRNKHYLLKRVAKLIRTLTPRLAASNALESEVNILCEASANKRAAKKFGSERVLEVAAVFHGV